MDKLYYWFQWKYHTIYNQGEQHKACLSWPPLEKVSLKDAHRDNIYPRAPAHSQHYMTGIDPRDKDLQALTLMLSGYHIGQGVLYITKVTFGQITKLLWPSWYTNKSQTKFIEYAQHFPLIIEHLHLVS